MRYFLLFLCILCFACRKDKVLLPGEARLLLPTNNEVCAEGTIVSISLSEVLFKWKAAENSDRYTITIKNLESGELMSKSTDQTQLSLSLSRGKPYSWFVLSENIQNGKEQSGEIWKFYNPGPAITSYSPFPAELLSPKYEEVIPTTTEKVSLKWSCTDADGDLSYFDVYLGVTAVPVLYRAAVKETTLTDLVLDRKKTYYWKIVAIDSKGNKSNSDVYSFKLN